MAALPFLPENIGRWWGNDPRKKREEIDIFGFAEGEQLFGECKWTNKLVDIDVMNELFGKAELLGEGERLFIFFSKSGFTKRFIKTASEKPNVQLITFEEMTKP